MTSEHEPRIVIITGGRMCGKGAMLEAIQQLVEKAGAVLVDDAYPIRAPEPGICINDPANYAITPAQVQHGPVQKRGKGKVRRW